MIIRIGKARINVVATMCTRSYSATWLKTNGPAVDLGSVYHGGPKRKWVIKSPPDIDPPRERRGFKSKRDAIADLLRRVRRRGSMSDEHAEKIRAGVRRYHDRVSRETRGRSHG